MSTNVKNLFFCFVFFTIFLIQIENRMITNEESVFDQKAVESLQKEPAVDNNNVNYVENQNVDQANNQQKMVPLSEEETKLLVKNFTEEESNLFKSFLQALAKSLEGLKDNVIFGEIEKMFAKKQIALNIVLSVIPCKAPTNENQLNDSIIRE
jgi:hypothetical protein